MNTPNNPIPAYIAQQLKPLQDCIAELQKRVADLEAARKERK